MFCQKCGAELNADSKFCGKCGEPTTPEVKASQNTSTDTTQSANTSSSQNTNQGASQGANQNGARSTMPSMGGLMKETVDPITGEVKEPLIKKVDMTEKIESDFLSDREQIKQMIGNTGGTAYYMQEFENMQSGIKSRFNIASFFLGVYHAAYRNMWREWLGVHLSTIILFAATEIVGLLGVMTFSIGLGSLTTLLWAVTSIVGIVNSVRMAQNFNLMYMHRLNDMRNGKLERTDGVSTKKALIAVGITFGIGVCIQIISAIVLESALNSMVW